MEKLYFTEEQDFRQSPLVWIVMISLFLGLLINILAVSGMSYFAGENSEPMTNIEVALTFSVIGLVIAVVMIIFFSSKLELKISNEGIRYRFPVFLRREKFISRDEIAAVFVGKYYPLIEFGGWGWRIKRLGNKRAYNVSGNKGLRVTLKSGKLIMFGTQREAELREAVNRMMTFEKTSIG